MPAIALALSTLRSSTATEDGRANFGPQGRRHSFVSFAFFVVKKTLRLLPPQCPFFIENCTIDPHAAFDSAFKTGIILRSMKSIAMLMNAGGPPFTGMH